MSYTVQHELKGHVSKSVPWWVVILILVVAASALVLAALYIGHRMGYAAAEKPIVLTKACIPAQTTRWACDAVELREYRNVCLRRMKRTGSE